MMLSSPSTSSRTTAWSTSNLLTLMPVFKGFLAAAACQDSHTQPSVCNNALHPCFMLLLHRVCKLRSVKQWPVTHVSRQQNAVQLALQSMCTLQRCISACNMHYMHILPCFRIPELGDRNSYVAAIEALPLVQTPEVFGLHANADISYYTSATKALWRNLVCCMHVHFNTSASA